MNASDIGVKVSKQDFVNFLNSVQGGQFFRIQSYKNQQEEVSDHVLRFGIKYENIKNKDIAFIKEAMRPESDPLSVNVTYGVWVDGNNLSLSIMENTSQLGNMGVPCKATYTTILNGTEFTATVSGIFDPLNPIFTNRQAKGRIPVTLSYMVVKGHPLFTEAIEQSLQSLVAPRETFVEYDKEGKSCYSYDKEDGSPVKWYMRDVLEVKKTVLVKGNYSFKASSAPVAIREAFARKFLLTSKYRQFILTEGNFQSITIEGQAIMVDGLDEAFYLALPEHIKEAVQVEAQAV